MKNFPYGNDVVDLSESKNYIIRNLKSIDEPDKKLTAIQVTKALNANSNVDAMDILDGMCMFYVSLPIVG